MAMNFFFTIPPDFNSAETQELMILFSLSLEKGGRGLGTIPWSMVSAMFGLAKRHPGRFPDPGPEIRPAYPF
jgi:hypothetical protein